MNLFYTDGRQKSAVRVFVAWVIPLIVFTKHCGCRHNSGEKMRKISAEAVISAVSGICSAANCELNPDVYRSLCEASANDESERARGILSLLVKNANIAHVKKIPICQDTGTAVFFVEIGEEARIDGNITFLINQGVREGYEKGFLRKSIVGDPLLRKNTGDNCPAVIHYSFVSGSGLKISLLPKGGGSENMSRLFMLSPSDGEEGVLRSVIQTVREAGSNACPPLIVGVGVGGNFEYAAILAKKALLRPIGEYSTLGHVKTLETRLLSEINKTGVGPAGLGGSTTALWLAVETAGCHIASFPVAVNLSCHAARHMSVCL